MNPATNPMISIPRSRFNQEFTHTTSFLHGDVIPIDCFEVIPGDDYSVHKAAAEIIMSTPIAPIFGNIKCKVTAIFCPMRLLWEHTEEFLVLIRQVLVHKILLIRFLKDLFIKIILEFVQYLTI